MGKLTSKMHSENITVHLLSGAVIKHSDQKQPSGGGGERVYFIVHFLVTV